MAVCQIKFECNRHPPAGKRGRRQQKNKKNEGVGFPSCLSVYDLEAVKSVKHQIEFCVYPIYTLQFPFDMDEFELDETRLTAIRNGYDSNLCVTVLNFSANEDVKK
jgi:hypothetical protein